MFDFSTIYVASMKGDVDSLGTQVSALNATTSSISADLSDLKTEFDTVISASTSDDEVLDARIGKDGTVYTTLKNRIDGDYNKLKATFSTTYNSSTKKLTISGF